MVEVDMEEVVIAAEEAEGGIRSTQMPRHCVGGDTGDQTILPTEETYSQAVTHLKLTQTHQDQFRLLPHPEAERQNITRYYRTRLNQTYTKVY